MPLVWGGDDGVDPMAMVRIRRSGRNGDATEGCVDQCLPNLLEEGEGARPAATDALDPDLDRAGREGTRVDRGTAALEEVGGVAQVRWHSSVAHGIPSATTWRDGALR